MFLMNFREATYPVALAGLGGDDGNDIDGHIGELEL